MFGCSGAGALIGVAEKGDMAALKADTTEPKCSTRMPLCRYRDYAAQALENRGRTKKAAAD